MLFKSEDVLPGCAHFTHKDALWLPQWNRMGGAGDGLNDEIMANLVALFQRMEKVRTFLNAPINVHCAFRPKLYNALVKGAKNSAHLTGQAVDFDVSNRACPDIRNAILVALKLQEWDMRMEDITGNWIHLDTRPLVEGGHRFFRP